MCQPNCWELIINIFFNSGTSEAAALHGVLNSHLYKLSQFVIVGDSGQSYSVEDGKSVHTENQKEAPLRVLAVLNYCTVHFSSNKQRRSILIIRVNSDLALAIWKIMLEDPGFGSDLN